MAYRSGDESFPRAEALRSSRASRCVQPEGRHNDVEDPGQTPDHVIDLSRQEFSATAVLPQRPAAEAPKLGSQLRERSCRQLRQLARGPRSFKGHRNPAEGEGAGQDRPSRQGSHFLHKGWI